MNNMTALRPFYGNTFEIKILQLIAVSKKDRFYWLEVILKDNTYAGLRLQTGLLNLYLFLKSGHNYSMYYKKPLKKIKNHEIEELFSKSFCCYDVPLGTHFVATHSTYSDVSDVSDAFTKLRSHDLVSFKGTISLKLFNNPIPSATSRVTNDRNFGTPGVKTHKILFEANDKILEVYLNNWENLAMPYGLIPDMNVIVHNVKPQKDKYYKSTVLTSVEIVSYEPKMRFETANLHDPDWGAPFFLGAGHSIPSFAIIWGRASVRSISSLKIYAQEIDFYEYELKGHITLIVEDSVGESKIIAKEDAAILLLRLLLGLEEVAFKKWVDGFHHWGELRYSAEPQVEQDVTSLLETFRFGIFG
ncbi:hypothetical protein Zmor_002820 [Zophobas morio]|uniref:Uncharacterized protein n=1 Tax=Zophobas morio TaxID=2755281 RepID=A0AA38HKP7_9CUCU|nr:hypothetical protein Zmor_002820 [Zophobas morio]